MDALVYTKNYGNISENEISNIMKKSRGHGLLPYSHYTDFVLGEFGKFKNNSEKWIIDFMYGHLSFDYGTNDSRGSKFNVLFVFNDGTYYESSLYARTNISHVECTNQKGYAQYPDYIITELKNEIEELRSLESFPMNAHRICQCRNIDYRLKMYDKLHNLHLKLQPKILGQQAPIADLLGIE